MWPPAAGAAEKQAGVTEVVLKGVIKEADGRRREAVLFTDQAGRQTGRMRFRTTEQEEHARNEGLTVFTVERPGASVWRGEQMARPSHTEHSETAPALEKKDGKR